MSLYPSRSAAVSAIAAMDEWRIHDGFVVATGASQTESRAKLAPILLGGHGIGAEK